MLKRSIFVMGLVGALATGAVADVVITYTSDIDRDPSTPGVIDLDPMDVATITINLVATDNEDGLGAAGFAFEGTLIGDINQPGTTVDNGGYFTISDFMFTGMNMDNEQMWFTRNHMSEPQAVAFANIFGLDFPTELAIFSLTADAWSDGDVVQNTGPVGFGDRNIFPVTLADGSGSFMVNVTPEPATFVLLAMGGLAMLRRR